MFQQERQEKLLQYINKHKKATVDQLAQVFAVSRVTIRRDINLFKAKGLVIKTHGGVLSRDSGLSYEIPFSNKADVQAEAKQRIGRKAAQLISNQDIVILDAGSTTLEIARHTAAKQVTVLTHDINIAMAATQKENLNLILAGGVLDKSVYTLTGSQTADFYRKVHVNKTFLGCDAIDLSFGISNRTMEEVSIKRAIMAAADEVIVVTDQSKLNKKVFFHLCDVAAVHTLVIDQILDEDRHQIEELGVVVFVAK